MKSLISKCIISAAIALTVMSVSTPASAYQCAWRNGHKVCWENGMRQCRWVGGFWRHGYYHHGHRVCWVR